MILATEFNCDQVLPVLDVMRFALTAIQWLAPILLILWGTIDLVKAVVAGKEDDVKKNQKVLVKRVISAVIIFLIPVAVSMLLGLIGSNGWKCCWKQAKSQIVSSEEDIDKRANQAEVCDVD